MKYNNRLVIRDNKQRLNIKAKATDIISQVMIQLSFNNYTDIDLLFSSVMETKTERFLFHISMTASDDSSFSL